MINDNSRLTRSYELSLTIYNLMQNTYSICIYAYNWIIVIHFKSHYSIYVLIRSPLFYVDKIKKITFIWKKTEYYFASFFFLCSCSTIEKIVFGSSSKNSVSVFFPAWKTVSESQVVLQWNRFYGVYKLCIIHIIFYTDSILNFYFKIKNKTGFIKRFRRVHTL